MFSGEDMAYSAVSTALMRRIIQTANTDILMFNAEISRIRQVRLFRKVLPRHRKPNLLMILVTNGGDPDSAYRIARCLQRNYEKVTVCISGICKSAGTLVALGAHELAFTDYGEIGPLDIQLAKKDDLWGQESGLTVTTALTALHENAQDAFDHFLVSLTTRSGGRITVRTASEIAAKLTQAIYSGISEQIDPIHLGEVNRSMAIARDYGKRLMDKGNNAKEEETLQTLISGYPSHSFVIDKEEAATLFKNVRECTPDEVALLEDLEPYSLTPMPADSPWVRFISDDVAEEDLANAQTASAQQVQEQPDHGGTVAQAETNVQTNGASAVPPAAS